MKFDSVFCSTPYTLVMIHPDGSFRMCCLTNNENYAMGGCIDEKTGEVMNIATHSLQDALNSKWHKVLRESHAKGEQHPMCSCCYNRDAIKGDSRRNYVSVNIPYKTGSPYPTAATSASVLDGNTVVKGPYALDLRFGNLCNLKCVTCGPWYSDKWIAEYTELYGRSSYQFGGNTVTPAKTGKVFQLHNEAGATPWWESDVWWSKFEEVLPQLKHLYITGGEPMLVPAHSKILKMCVDRGFAKNIVIEIDTNLTALNPNIIEQWSHFKHIDLRVSLDDVGPSYEFIRYPGVWPDMQRNLRTVLESRLPNVKVLLTSCITALNLFHLDDIEDFNTSLGLASPSHCRYIDKPVHLDIRTLSPAKKDFALEALAKQTSLWARRTEAYLRDSYTQESADAQAHFVKFFDFLDGSRGTDWRKSFPQTSQMFEL